MFNPTPTMNLGFWDPNQSWVDWGLVLVLLLRTVLGGPRWRTLHRETGRMNLLRQLEELMTET